MRDNLSEPFPLLPPPEDLPAGQGSILRIDPEELCRQMCLVDEELWHAIEPWELLGLAWLNKDKEVKSPNVLKMIANFNKVSNWVKQELLTEVSTPLFWCTTHFSVESEHSVD